MSRIHVLLKDLPADRQRGRSRVRAILSPEQWDEVLAHYERGVSTTTMFAALSGNVSPFFNGQKQLQNAILAERAARKKRAGGGAND